MAAFAREPIEISGHDWRRPWPTSSAVRMGDLLFVSGQIAVDNDFEPLARGDIRAQTTVVLDQTRAIVEEAGGSLDDVVELMVFLRDMRDLEAVFEVARGYWSQDYPAWTVVGSLGFQRAEALLSVRTIAHLGTGPKATVTPDTQRWLRQYPVSAGCRKGDYIFVSSQVAADADGLLIAPGNHAAQARYCYNRLREVVEALGGSVDDVTDMITFHQDARGMEAAVGVWTDEFVNDRPFSEVAAVTAIGMPMLPQLGMLTACRAIADLSDGGRVAKTPPSIWWKVMAIAGGAKKSGGHLIGLAGQVASDGDGEITTPGDIAAQARYAFNRLREVLAEFDAGMESIAEIVSFHKDPRAWEIVMEVGKEYFPAEGGPAWTPVGATGLYQEGYLHEIYAVAVV